MTQPDTPQGHNWGPDHHLPPTVLPGTPQLRKGGGGGLKQPGPAPCERTPPAAPPYSALPTGTLALGPVVLGSFDVLSARPQ